MQWHEPTYGKTVASTLCALYQLMGRIAYYKSVVVGPFTVVST